MIENATAARLSELLMDMADSMTVNFAYHANDPGVGFSLHADYDYFKMFLADTGLFVTLAFMDRVYTENVIYRKLLSDKLGTDLGYVYENAIAQMLKSAGNELFYYTFKEEILKDEEENRTVRSYEIDFLLSRKDKICPIEVKSSGYNSHKSLDKFQQKFSGENSSPVSSLYQRFTKRQGYFLLACIHDGIIIRSCQEKNTNVQELLILNYEL